MMHYAVDLDGTLAEYHGWNFELGKPIPAMVERVKQWLANGDTVTIFTARVFYDPTLYSEYSCRFADREFVMQQMYRIEQWCLEVFGTILPITAEKDLRFDEFWDDRCVTVERNTGRILTIYE